MDFQQIPLPDQPVFRDAFNAGWEKYMTLFSGDESVASARYMQGPAALARLIFEHGGECRKTAAAACLAGPALFSETPSHFLSTRLIEFSREVASIPATPEELETTVSEMSGDARLFLQASAIMLLEQLAENSAGASEKEKQRTYDSAVRLYAAVSCEKDVFNLDTRFEIAAMKATTALESCAHTWCIPHKHAANG